MQPICNYLREIWAPFAPHDIGYPNKAQDVVGSSLTEPFHFHGITPVNPANDVLANTVAAY